MGDKKNKPTKQDWLDYAEQLLEYQRQVQQYASTFTDSGENPIPPLPPKPPSIKTEL
jgi:hypothetical protein